MKKIIVFMLIIFLGLGPGSILAGEKAPAKVVELAHSRLAALGTNPIIVEAVRAENSKAKSLAQIQAMDEKWRATPGIADFMNILMESDCARFLRDLQGSSSFYAEIFVMDNQGANVAMTDKTSDYWQGDEAKFQKSYNGGAGGVHISDVEFDDSTQAYLVQISVPVKDGDLVIGAITFGIDVDKIK